MLRTEAQELQRKLGDTVDWFLPVGSELPYPKTDFSQRGTYTYRTRATIKLDGRMVTPEQAAAEWWAKKETHDLWYGNFRGHFFKTTDTDFQPNSNEYESEYELRPKALKQPTWTGSREDVLALLKEEGLL
jgi:hypothetical protein